MSSSRGDELTKPVPVAFDISVQTGYPDIRGGDEIQKGVGFVRGCEGGSGNDSRTGASRSRVFVSPSAHQKRADRYAVRYRPENWHGLRVRDIGKDPAIWLPTASNLRGREPQWGHQVR